MNTSPRYGGNIAGVTLGDTLSVFRSFRINTHTSDIYIYIYGNNLYTSMGYDLEVVGCLWSLVFCVKRCFRNY